jgi:hypothetical protein
MSRSHKSISKAQSLMKVSQSIKKYQSVTRYRKVSRATQKKPSLMRLSNTRSFWEAMLSVTPTAFELRHPSFLYENIYPSSAGISPALKHALPLPELRPQINSRGSRWLNRLNQHCLSYRAKSSHSPFSSLPIPSSIPHGRRYSCFSC